MLLIHLRTQELKDLYDLLVSEIEHIDNLFENVDYQITPSVTELHNKWKRQRAVSHRMLRAIEQEFISSEPVALRLHQ